MSRYIDADVLLKYKAQLYDENGVGFYAVGTGNILRMPTADVAPVVHGEWIPNESDRHHHCSVCMEDALCKEDWQFLDCVEILSEYCPNCGAKMSTQSNAFLTH